MEIFGIKNNTDVDQGFKNLKSDFPSRSFSEGIPAFKTFLKKINPDEESNLTSLTDGRRMKEIIDSSNSTDYKKIEENIDKEPLRLRPKDGLSGYNREAREYYSSENFKNTEYVQPLKSKSGYRYSESQNELDHGSVLNFRDKKNFSSDASGKVSEVSNKDNMLGLNAVENSSGVVESEHSKTLKEVLSFFEKGPANHNTVNKHEKKSTDLFGSSGSESFKSDGLFVEERPETKALDNLNMPILGNIVNQFSRSDQTVKLGGKLIDIVSSNESLGNSLNKSVAADGNNKRSNDHVKKLLGKNVSNQSANEMSSNVTNGGNQTSERAQNQASALSKLLGNQTRTKISVTVADESKLLSSKPSLNLSSANVIPSLNSNQRKTAKTQGNSATVNTPVTNQINIGQMQAVNHLNGQQQNLLQSSQSTNNIQASMEAKTSSPGFQSSLSSNAGGSNTNVQNNLLSNSSARQTQQSNQNRQANLNLRGPVKTFADAISEQISIKILKGIQSGNDRIKIQLRPAELGRVDVKMEVAHDGRVLAIVSADNKDTLELLRRDSSDLQRAFGDGGMTLNSGDLTFTLRKEEKQAEDSQDTIQPQNVDDEASIIGDEELGYAPGIIGDGNVWLNGRIDIRA